MKFNECGSVQSCSAFFLKNPFKAVPNDLFSWNFTITPGYNKILLPSPITVPKGSIILLLQDSSSATTVSVDTTGNSVYPDLIWSTNLNSLSSVKNWRLYLTALTNFTNYENSFSVLHKYASIGVFKISMTFISSNQIFDHVVNITDCIFLSILC